MWKTIALLGALPAFCWANPLAAADEKSEGLVTISTQGFADAAVAPGGEGMQFSTGGPIQFLPEGKFWIGALTVPVPPALRAQLALAENEGLLVHAILPKSPAEKAGLKEYDVLLKAGGAILASPADLIAAAEKAKDKPLAVELIRGGKRQTLAITPIPRSAGNVAFSAGPGVMFFGGATAEGERYFLGVAAGGLAPELRKKLNLPEKQGVEVQEVVPKSPAEQAGLKKGNVIVRAGGKPIENIAGLSAAVQKSEGKPLALELLRDGKPQTIQVVPEKRPSTPTQFDFLSDALRNDPAAMRLWLERQRAEHPGGTLGYHIIHPGVILPPPGPAAIRLPPGTSISITREGDKPAKIVVKQGEKKWEVNEGQLDKLPPDLRPLAEQMAGHGPLSLSTAVSAGPDVLRLATPGEIHMQRQLDEMGREVNELRKALEELRGKEKPQSAEK